jgi:hypothetical protein
MTMRPDDLPARLVRAAALQLGNKPLIARYEQEWLGSLPPRDRYQRWRYALSLFLRGARATRWAVHLPPADATWPSLRAKIRDGVCLLAITTAIVMLLARYYQLYTPVWGSLVTDFAGWCLMVGALVLLSFCYRGARWAAGCGVLLSLIQTWTNTAFLQGGGPLETIVASVRTDVPGGELTVSGFMQPDVWYWVQAAACLGALFGGVAVVFRYRAPLLVRTFAGLAVCVLVVGAYTSFGAPAPVFLGDSSGNAGFTMLQFRFFFLSWYPPVLDWPSVANNLADCVQAVIWGAQILVLGFLVGLAQRLLSLTISLLRVPRAS